MTKTGGDPQATRDPADPAANSTTTTVAEHGCLQDDCAPNCKNVMADGVVCDRYVELWNLVFMQFYHHLDGTRTPLPAPSVDTGMGFERLVRILQDVDTAYETDIFTPIIAAVERVSGKSYDNPDDTYAIRVVAEHGRSVTFLIADGVVPGNEGRGYVLRRVIRRAIRYARRLGVEDIFLGEIADATIDKMGHVYPELVNNRDFILTVLRLEEERFQQAFQNGYNMLTEALEDVSASSASSDTERDTKNTLDGATMFRLWDTYGFPVEMTQEIAAEQGVAVDTEGFEREMEAQRQRGRASAQFGEERIKIRQYESLGVGATQFLGYEQVSASSPIVGLIADDEVVSEATAGQRRRSRSRPDPLLRRGRRPDRRRRHAHSARRHNRSPRHPGSHARRHHALRQGDRTALCD